MFLQMQHFCFPDLGKEKLRSILVFGNVCFNHDNVASRGAVGRTHTIVRLQTRIRRKDGTENFGGFVFVLDLYNGIFRCGFCVVGNFSPFSGYHAEGYHARTDTFKPTGYHICRVTTPELPRSVQTSGYRRVITPAGSF